MGVELSGVYLSKELLVRAFKDASRMGNDVDYSDMLLNMFTGRHDGSESGLDGVNKGGERCVHRWAR